MSRRYNRGGPSEASGGPWEEDRPRERDLAPRDGTRRTVLVMGPGARSRGGPLGSPASLEPSSGYPERPQGNSPLLTARQGPSPTESSATGAPGGTRKLPFMALSDIIRQQHIKGKVSLLHGQQQHQLQQQERSPSPTRQQQQQRQDSLPPSQQRQQQQQQQGSARNALFGSERATTHQGRVSSVPMGAPLGEHRRVRDMSGGAPSGSDGGRQRGPPGGAFVEGPPQETSRTLQLRERPSCSPAPPFRGPSPDRGSDRESRRHRGITRAAELRGHTGSARAPGESFNRDDDSPHMGAPRGSYSEWREKDKGGPPRGRGRLSPEEDMGGTEGGPHGYDRWTSRRRNASPVEDGKKEMQIKQHYSHRSPSPGRSRRGAPWGGRPSEERGPSRGALQATPQGAVQLRMGGPDILEGPMGGGLSIAGVGIDGVAAVRTLRESGAPQEEGMRRLETPPHTTAPIDRQEELGMLAKGVVGPPTIESFAAAEAASCRLLRRMRTVGGGPQGAAKGIWGGAPETLRGPQEALQEPPLDAQLKCRRAPQERGGPGAPSKWQATPAAAAEAAAAADRRACITTGDTTI
ncbi:hypothetical protein, conserved [Eimeria praecox]|uniref:Uncharacterized protein n=1 Tax=Eimeria praecox TaxID=51316 RepID=U6H611_9EIME|nr:hypothetical protein, conserved [Eimeria praecox]